MKITKIGHCCLLIEEQGVRLLTDPGAFTTDQNDLENLDAILITHEHYDHLHIDSVKAIVIGNPDIQIITNTSVGKLLDAADIKYTLIADGETLEVKGVTIKGIEGLHAEVYGSIPRVLNTALMIANTLFYPGDAFINPDQEVPLLALPVAGPWMKMSEALDYAILLKPKLVFPVHDGILRTPGMFHPQAQKVLNENHIEFTSVVNGEDLTFTA
jgi:L-ascorbate metabolism protein UlaG (beta-lactamase superfamily)